MSKPKRQRDSANPKAARVTVRIQPAQLADLQAQAERQGITVGELVRRAIAVIAPPQTK